MKFYDGNKLLYEQAAQKSELKYAARKDSIGKGYYKGGQLINSTMDFSKNSITHNSLAFEEYNMDEHVKHDDS